MMLRSALVLLVLYAVAPPIGAVLYLYYSSPGDSLGHYSGVWGGPIDIHKKGKADNLRQSGFHCAYMYDGGFYTGFIVKGMFLDPISKRVIVHLLESFDNRVSLIEGPICTEQPECPSEISGHVQVYMAHGENEDLIAAKPGPFAMWNSSVYMVVQRWSQGAHRHYHHRLELRHLTGCKDQYPFTIHRRADIDECSRLLATLRQEQMHKQDATTFRAAYHLHIIQADTDELSFITQIYNWTLDEIGERQQIGMTLLYATASGTITELHYTPLPDVYAKMKLRLVETGGVSWRDDTLCWSSVEVIRCATWLGTGELRDIRIVLQPGEAASVCYDSDVYLNKANITTGVAIADTTDGISLYFGCRSDKPMEGGAGFLSMPDDGTHGESHIEALSDRADIIYASSMFLTDLCDIRPISMNDKDRYDSDSNSTEKDPRASAAVTVSGGCSLWIYIILTCTLDCVMCAVTTRGNH